MARHSAALVIVDGDVTGLIACAMALDALNAAEPSTTASPADRWLAWCPSDVPAVVAAARRHAELYGLEFQHVPLAAMGSLISPGSPGELTTRMLIAAAWSAAASGRSRVVWPLQPGVAGLSSVDAVSLAADRAVLASRLVAIDTDEHSAPSLRIETPFLDLADEQIAELAHDLGVPVQTCWWFAHTADEDPALDAARSRARWLAALEAVGFRFARDTIVPPAVR